MIQKPRRWLLVLAVLTVMAMALGACAPAATPEPTKPPAPAPTTPPVAQPTQPPTPVPSARGTCGTLRVLWWQASTILNSHLAQGQKDFDASRLVYEPLAAINEKGEPDIRYGLGAEVPTLANGGIAKDGLSVTWKLKQGVKWSDGSAFSADDVVFTWQYVTDPKTAATDAEAMVDIKTVEKVDANTIKITWKDVNPNPYIAFTGLFGYIIQKKSFENYMGEKAKDAPANLKPVGTGPYVVKEFKPDDVVTYEINPNYRDPNKPCFKEVVFKGGGDATSAARAVLQTGDVDWSWNLQVTADVLQQLAAGGKGDVAAVAGPNVERILINRTNPDPALGDKRGEPGNSHPFLTELKVRQALALAIDRKSIGDKLYGGKSIAGEATCNIVTAPPAFVSTTKFETCEFNIEKANKLLDEAGWVKGADGIRAKGGVKMKIIYQTTVNPVRQATQQIVKQGWEQLGIQVELKSVQAGVFFSSDVANPDTAAKFWTDVEMFTNGSSQPDDPGYVGGWTCDQIKTKAAEWRGNNYERWCNAEYDKLYAQLRLELDPAKRAALYKQMNDILINDVVMIPLVARNSVGGKHKSLKGPQINPWDSDLWNALDWTNK